MEWDICKIRIEGFRIEMDMYFLNSTGFVENRTSCRGYLKGKFAFASFPYMADEKFSLKFLKENLISEAPEDPVPEGYEGSFSYKGIKIGERQGKDMLLQLKDEIENEDGVRIEKIFINFKRKNLSIKNSKGMNVEGETGGINVGGAVIVEKDGEAQINYDIFHFSEMNFDLKEIARSLKEPAKMLLKSEPPPTGRFRCILQNRVACELLEAFIQSFTAESLFKNRTMLKNKEGERIFSEILTIEENNPSFKEPFYMPFDGEGVKKERVFIVRNGRFENFLYNAMYGRIYGKKPCGSSRPEPASPPSLTGSSILINGDTPYEKLVEKMGEGFIVTGIIGGHTVNPITGEFSVGASGIFIKNGKKPFVGGVISGNFFEIFNKVEATGNDFRTIGNITSPSILISEINLGG
jgi:PmbA protein